MNQRILLTGPETPLGQRLEIALGTDNTVVPAPDALLGDRDRLAEIAGKIDVIIHLVNDAPGSNAAAARLALDRATRGTYDLLTTGKATKFILVSSLRPFLAYSPGIQVDERFAPRPTTSDGDLIPYLAEITLRETSRVRPIESLVLRVGTLVDGDQGQTPLDLHIDDAVQAVERALAYPAGSGQERPTRFRVLHIVDGGDGRQFPPGAAFDASFGYAPAHKLTANLAPIPPSPAPPKAFADPAKPVERITIYGAGGPIPAETAAVLAPTATLRLTDILSIDELQQRPPQQEGAPQLAHYGPPHEHRVVDVTDADQVLAAAEGADTLIVCSVIRPDPVAAFEVNMLGALNVMRAAVAHGIRRVVHTGPVQTLLRHPYGYDDEFGLIDDLPPRPGGDLYFTSKFLGQEIVRIFAEEHDLIVPNLLFGNFVNPALPLARGKRLVPFAISWRDCANAIALAARVPSLPRPFETMHVLTDLPHGKYHNDKAKRLLDWEPQDNLSAFWRRT